MSRTHYFYFRLTVSELEQLVRDHQESFDLLLNDSFSDEELLKYEKQLDSIAAVFPQPILSELTFDDFYPDKAHESEQRAFFERCRSSICLENLPYFEENPFQVSYLTFLLERFEEVLIDQGGVNELMFKGPYLLALKKFKNIDSLMSLIPETIVEKTSTRPVFPIDFLILDVYKELDRLKDSKLNMEDKGEKLNKIFLIMQSERLDSSSILKKSGLIPKDFEDNLERLKFTLKKIS
jgi:hypothetical protein